jgi:uncharacterized membrane protein YhaH (DUF805 family)
MKEYLTTEGRLSRLGVWKFQGVLFSVLLMGGGLMELLGEDHPIAVIFVLLTLPLMFMSLIVQIKRWHDRDKSGSWAVVSMIPIIGWIWGLIELGYLKGTSGSNTYGRDPLRRRKKRRRRV